MTYPTDLLTVNAFIISSGGTGGHATMLSALNELLTLQSVTAGKVTNLAALNALAVGLGATGGYVSNLAALNAISVAIGGTGGYHTTLAAWTEIAGLGFSYSPSQDALDIYLSSRSGNTLTDSVSSLNAKILPAVYKGNSSGYYDYTASALFSDDSWSHVYNLEITTVPSGNMIMFWGQGTQLYFRISSSNNWQFYMRDGTNNRDITISTATLPFQARKYSFLFVHDKAGSTTIYESGVQVGTASGTFTNLATAGSAKYLYIGYSGENGNTLSNKANAIESIIYSDTSQTTKTAHYIFTGETTCYDVSGNNRHLTGRSIVAANKSYSLNGSLYCFDSGYTIWEKAASADIIAPAGVTTSPIAAGYSIARVFPGSATKLNFADALIGFNETGSADTKLNIFDRSNTTIQTAASRASAYYSATSLATKSRFHTSELAPYEKMLTWYNTDYQDRVFGNLSKLTTDFSLTEIFVSSAKKTGSTLAKVKTYCHTDGIYYVGASNNFRKIQRAVTYAYAGNTLNIATGIYSELIDLSSKLLNLVGNGTLETIINYVTAASAPDHVFKIGTASTFTNIIADHEETTTSGGKSIVYVNNSNPIFTNCKIGQNYYSNLGANKSLRPILLEGTSQVTCINTDILGAFGVFSEIKDTAQLTMQGGSIKAGIKLLNTGKLLGTCNYLWGTATELGTCIIANDDSVITLELTGGTRIFNGLTGAEYADGTVGQSIFCHDNAEVNLSGVGMYHGVWVDADAVNAVVNIDNMTTSKGGFFATTQSGTADTVVINVNNSHLVHDVNNDVNGLHMYECPNFSPINIEDSILEWSGHSGNWFTMGSPLYGLGPLTMKRSTLIDNINDSAVSYLLSISCGTLVDLEDCEIIHQNSIGTPYNFIVVTPQIGRDFHIRIKDTSFTNGNVAGTLIYVNWSNRTISAGDYICVEGLTKDANIALFDDSLGSGITMYNTLVSQCPF